jgi:hypothetical protein
MALPTRRSGMLVFWLAFAGLLTAQDTGKAVSAPSAQGWTRFAMPARQAPNSGVSYNRSNGAPTWLLPTQQGLIAFGAGEDCCPPQLSPTEWISRDGKTWRRILVPSSTFGAGRISAMAAGGPGLVAVGVHFAQGAPKPGPPPPATWFSPDGRTWRGGVSVGNAFEHAEILNVIANGDGFVAVGDVQSQGDEFSPFSIRMAVWQSSDGFHWQRVSDSSPVFQDASASVVLHGGEGLVALGAARNGLGFDSSATTIVWTSRDGRVWQRVPQPPGVFPTLNNFHLVGAVEGNGRYVAWGTNYSDVPYFLVWTSTDGSHWTQAPGVHFQYGRVDAIAAHGQGFIAVGARDNEPTLWSSPDGAHWAPTAGEDVFGGGDTQLTGAIDWHGEVVVVGAFNRPPPLTPSQFYRVDYTPSAWLSQPGTRGQVHPPWARSDPKWFRLRIDDLPRGFHVQVFGPSGYFIGCELNSDLLLRGRGTLQRTQAQPLTDVAGPCRHALAALGAGPSLPFYYRFPYGPSALGNSGNAPYVGGFAILTSSPAKARAAFGYASGLVHAVDLNLNRAPAKPIRSLAVGQGAELFSQSITSPCPAAPPQCPPFPLAGTAYAVVWRDGPALGVVEVVGVPGDRAALAIKLAQRQWSRRHALGF